MANYSIQIAPYAISATIRTGLSRCDQIVNVTQTIQNLSNLYRNNLSNVFANLSVVNFNCTISSGKYFEQILIFIHAVSIHVQIGFASIYYDYIDANQYALNGFHIDMESRFNLSSITLIYTGQSDACSSANTARDPLCPLNSTTPICVTLFPNPWIYNCSENVSTSTISPWLTTTNDQSLSNVSSGVLSQWQIGLICSFGVLFLLLILLALGCLIRRRSRTKLITISRENLVSNTESRQSSGIPQVQVIRQTPIIIQPKPTTKITPVIQFHHGKGPNWNKGYMMNRKPPKPSNLTAFSDHPTVLNLALPSKMPPKTTKPIFISNNHLNTVPPKLHPTTFTSRPVSGTSTKQLRSITNGLEEDTLDECDDISLDRLITMNRIKPSTPITNMSSIDESLHDEDAWMPILAVANAELDVLNRLESEQNRLPALV